jgi:hypothetical protein
MMALPVDAVAHPFLIGYRPADGKEGPDAKADTRCSGRRWLPRILEC